MIKSALTFVICFFLMASSYASPVKKYYDITFSSVKDKKGDVSYTLDLSFYEKLPPPASVDKLLKESLVNAVATNPTHSILAIAFLGEDTLKSNQYSGPLVYDSKIKKIVTIKEHEGVQTKTIAGKNYLLEIEENKTLEGIKPERKWLTISIVFSSKPTEDDAYNAVAVESQKLESRNLDLYLYVLFGNQKVKTSWNQLRDKDGSFVFAMYDTKTKQLTKKSKLLR